MIFDYAIPYENLPESDKDLKRLLNYNPQHNEYTRKQNIPERSPDETDRGGWRGYDRVYTKYLSDKKDDIKNLLEIGIYYGYGLLTWARYFRNAKIYGIDINISDQQLMEIEKIQSKFPEFSKVNWTLSDSTKRDMWLQFEHNQFDVIIDDGDHHPLSQINTLDCAWYYLKPGGMYFIEDVSHRYGEQYISLLNDKLKQFKKENYMTIYSHENAGLKYLSNSKTLRNNGIIDFTKPTEYIVVLQKL